MAQSYKDIIASSPQYGMSKEQESISDKLQKTTAFKTSTPQYAPSAIASTGIKYDFDNIIPQTSKEPVTLQKMAEFKAPTPSTLQYAQSAITPSPDIPTSSSSPVFDRYNYSPTLTPAPKSSVLNMDTYRPTLSPDSPAPNNSISQPQLTQTPTTPATDNKVSHVQAESILNKSGLGKYVKADQLVGRSFADAYKIAEQERQKRLSGASSSTSYAYNSAKDKSFNDRYDKMKLSIDTIKNDAFKNPEQKVSETQSLLKITVPTLVSSYDTVDEFNSALNNPDLRSKVAEYQKLGGQMTDIYSAIQNKTPRPADVADYLTTENTADFREAKKNFADEESLMRDEFNFINEQPNKLRDFYYGNENQIGILEQEKQISAEKKKLLEDQLLQDNLDEEKKAKLEIDKLQEEERQSLYDIEQNRIKTNNYYMGMLAKLGALNTTGAAIDAISNIEIKYRESKQRTSVQYRFKVRDLEEDLDSKIAQLKLKTRNDILKITEDLNKTSAATDKEIYAEERKAEKEMYKLQSEYLDKFKKEKDKVTKERESNAKKAASAARKAMESFDIQTLYAQYQNSVIKNTQVPLQVPSFSSFIKGNLKVPFNTRKVITGEKALSDFTPSQQIKIEQDLEKVNISPDETSYYNQKQSDIKKVQNYLKEKGADEEQFTIVKYDPVQFDKILQAIESNE